MFPKINEVLFIQIDTGDEAASRIVYKSRIAEMDEQSLYIEVPIEEGSGRLKKLFLGDELSLYFVTEGGVKNYFNSYVLGFHEDVIRQIRIRRPEEESISRIQRRSFLRVQADLEVAVTTGSGKQFVTRTEDVGGGGVSLYAESHHGIADGETLDCWLLAAYKNGAIEHIPFSGEVVRIKEISGSRSLVMVKLSRISDMERQKLIRYCFERQFDFRNR
ncbi:flagellar brake domain-containing protein [Paenibacillus sp. F411]|uniref:flagellar brake protein n=1 Tax=unclassified Paenibacillus TaxID=185978 RepID=UPI001AAEA340|nr:flagellar brake domain-containing protein [Paenibacillus sp. F411]